MQRQERTLATPLARRLRELRQSAGLTQRSVADALVCSVPLISSWESGQAIPPATRLADYAALIARASADPDESGRRERLIQELTDLREREGGGRATVPSQPTRHPLEATTDTIGGGPWYFPDGRPITIVCSVFPDEELAKIPNSQVTDADFVKSYRYTDLDALIELHGHIRAVNPATHVSIRAGNEVTADDLTTHLVLLGGVDWNPTTRQILNTMNVPVAQTARPDDNGVGHFHVDDPSGNRQTFHPEMSGSSSRSGLLSDVALFYRGRNPYNDLRTVTICDGMFGRGTYGVVRALTDVRFRDRNAAYIAERFGTTAFCILSRVRIFNNETMTPDWRSERLYEWSEPDE